MRFLRAFIKLILFLAVTLFLYSLIMVCLAGSILGVNYPKCRTHLLRFWGKCSCFVLGLRVEVKGEVPKPPFILLSNHLSYLDVFVLFSQLRTLFVAKSDVQTWPLVGFIIRTCGILFIDRNRKRDITRVNDLISENITPEQGIIIFPEGTTSPGYDILPFKTSLLKNAVAMDIPVSYATISYSAPETQTPAYQSMCWWGDDSFVSHFLRFLQEKNSIAKIHFGTHPIECRDRKELAQQIHHKMSSQFEPVIEKDEFVEKHDKFQPLTI
ncbi:MAG: hypothetical protein CL666_07705 [Balneola sp.]|nr:hypothetical protein [Balneola sp.]